MSAPAVHTPVEWSVRCDGADCSSSVTGTGFTDRQAIELALTIATLLLWQIEPDRFIRPRPDLCPTCKAKQR